MDRELFDRIARLFAVAGTRRAGLGAALGALAGAAAAEAGAGNRGNRGRGQPADVKKRPDPEGPCGDRSGKANRCKRDTQCCTGYCRKGKKGKIGRCRCAPKGYRCTAKTVCCKRMACVDGVCSRTATGTATCVAAGGACGGGAACCAGSRCENGVCVAEVPTGQPCVAGVDTCQAAAACIPYYQGDPGGNFCLLPAGKACAAAGDCASNDCAGGVCAAEACTVCSSGCDHDTVQEALDAAVDGAVIRIAAGTYEEDLKTTNIDLTLTNCNGGEVTLVNASDDSRTIILGEDTDAAPHKTVIIRNLTITGSGTPVAGNPYPITEPTVGTGGIDAYMNLILEGTAKVTGCNWPGDHGGGIYVYMEDEALSLTVRGKAEVTNNYSAYDGGGVYIDSYATLFLADDAKISGNFAGAYGGGFAASTEAIVRMSGRVEVSYNRCYSGGSGGSLEGGAFEPTVIMSDDSRIIFNIVVEDNDGALYFNEGSGGGYTLTMHDNALIADNRASYGAAISFGDEDAILTMDGNALVTRNTSTITPTYFGGSVYSGVMNITGNASIKGNTPVDCYDVTFDPASKQCGV